jgi:hypothetical protein
VLLDDKVDLEVPLDDLASARAGCAQADRVSEGDGILHPHTRRVADYSHIDPSDVEADAGNKSAGAKDATSAAPTAARAISLQAARDAGRKARRGHKEDKAASLKGTPISLARGARGSLRKIGFDRGQISDHPHLDQLKAWSRACTIPAISSSRRCRLRRSDAGRDIRHRIGAGAERCLLRPACPQAIRRRHRPVRRRPCPDQIKAATRSRH